MSLSKSEYYLLWVCKIVAAIIMLQTLYFKFSGAEESVYIFSKLGVEPWGRIGTGAAELFASILLFSRFAWLGALAGTGIMSGALISHIAVLGIEVQEDGGYLFALCLLVLISCFCMLILIRKAASGIFEFRKLYGNTLLTKPERK